MFFVLSKTLALLLLPSNFLFIVLTLGAALTLTRWRRAGRWLAGAALVCLVTLMLLPLGPWLLHHLETRFPRWDEARGAPDGVIVLGGAVNPGLSRAHGLPVTGEHADRIFAIARLARAYPQARIVFTGGDGSLIPRDLAEAAYLPPLLDDLGVPRERVLLENRARNTAENASLTKALLRPKPGERWLLVTTAWHMPRAVGCFRKVGFDVEAYPVGWRTGRAVPWSLALHVGGALAALDLAVHEWTGLVVYRLTGRTAELVPSAL